MSISQQPFNLAVIPATAGTYYMPKGVTTALAVAVPALINITGDGGWTEATKTLTKTGAFTSYTFVAGDTIAVTAGTGATAGTYTIASRTSNNAIVLTTSIGAGADLATQVSNRSVMNLTNSPTGIFIDRIEANGVAAAATDSIAVANEAGTTQQGAIFLARGTVLGGPVLDAKPQGIFVQGTADHDICFTTVGTTSWTVQYLPFAP